MVLLYSKTVLLHDTTAGGGTTIRQRARAGLPAHDLWGDKMTVAIHLDLPGVTGARPASAWGTLNASRQEGNPVRVARSIAAEWRDREAWDSPEMIEALIRSAARFIADAAAGDPTWEDAAWQ